MISLHNLQTVIKSFSRTHRHVWVKNDKTIKNGEEDVGLGIPSIKVLFVMLEVDENT